MDGVSPEIPTTPFRPHLFSLKSIGRPFEIQHDFTPQPCRKTHRVLSIIPTYNVNNSPYRDTFDNEFDASLRQLNSLNIADHSIHHIEIDLHPAADQPIVDHSIKQMISRPRSRYCQICKETYDDYLKHTMHPLHLKKIKEKDEALDFQSLSSILQFKSQKNTQKVKSEDQEEETRKWAEQGQVQGISQDRKDDQEKAYSSTSIKRCCEYEPESKRSICGSKKRIILNDSGQIQAVDVPESTEYLEQQQEVVSTVRRGVKRKFSIFRNLPSTV